MNSSVSKTLLPVIQNKGVGLQTFRNHRDSATKKKDDKSIDAKTSPRHKLSSPRGVFHDYATPRLMAIAIPHKPSQNEPIKVMPRWNVLKARIMRSETMKGNTSEISLNTEANLTNSPEIKFRKLKAFIRSSSKCMSANLSQRDIIPPEQATIKLCKADLSNIDTIENESNEEIKMDFTPICPELDIQKQSLATLKQKKRRGYTALSEMVPLNLEEEKKKFFEKDCKYNPQFVYNSQYFKQQFSKQHKKYLKHAKAILNSCIKEFGSDENYLDKTGGRLISKEEAEIAFNNYVKQLGVQDQIDIEFSEKIVSSTSVVHDSTGKSRMIISLPINYRLNRIQGVLDHEIGTHFIRKINDRGQPWFQNRKKYDLKAYIIIEEGLASLNQTLCEAFASSGRPYLYNAALHYYSGYLSSMMGFEQLYAELEKYIKDPYKRFKECVRVKRGMTDTSLPGGMYKDQVYLRGVIEILKNRKKIDFPTLHMGKLHMDDLPKLTKNK